MSEQVAPSSVAASGDAPQPADQPTATHQPTSDQMAATGLSGAQPTADAGPPPEAKRSATRKVLGVVGAVLAIGVIVAVKFGLGTAVAAALDEDGTAKAKVGDCVTELPDATGGEHKDAPGAELVACTSPKAVYTVIGRVDGQTEAQARTGQACEPFLQPGQAGYFFYNIRPGGTGYLLCLTKKA